MSLQENLCNLIDLCNVQFLPKTKIYVKNFLILQNIDQLKKFVAEYVEKNKDQKRRHSGLWDYDIMPTENIIAPNKIGTVK